MFKDKLEKMLQNFDLEKAEELSMELHHAEEKGIELTEQEDLLWGKLTVLIFRKRQGVHGLPDESEWNCLGCN